MKKEKPKKTIYYKDELNDDFAGTKIKTRKLDANFKYIHKNPIWRFCSFLIYYLVAVPLVWVYVRLLLRVKFVNKKTLKKVKPCFIYGNHTSFIDAFIPSLLSLPRRNKIIVGADAVSIIGLKNLTQMLGALPLPASVSGLKKFSEAVDYYARKQNISIYPEAHIWPFYTKVRPFVDSSFAYPVKLNHPVVAFFTAYTKPKGFLSCFRKANVTVYVSNPIYPNQNLPRKESQKALRDEVYAFMQAKSKQSTYEVIEYRKDKNK